ncbi:MAG: leucine-rich repeat protein [Treponema sp.]|jgi:hypothetical protein|nr:leucine-rich repeat protein [Treponema sp.]
MNKVFSIAVLILLIPALSWAGGSKDNSAPAQPQTQPSPAPVAQPQTPQAQQTPTPPAPVSPFFTGNGGKDISLTILAPKASGLADNQSYLPSLVQGEFVSNFSGFSAVSVLDRVRLDEQYAELLSGYYSDNAEAGMDLGHLIPTTHLMTGTITRTATGFALQMQITRNADKMTQASYSGTFTFAELDNLTGIRRASLDLLEKMGVTPTERTRTELSVAATANYANAQTALAQGITAQRQGTVVEALSHFIQSVNVDPGLAEAASRMNILSASISSGNIGADTRNDIAWRRQWTERLQEAEAYYTNYVNQGQPYNLVYDAHIKQGDINYQTETVNLSFWMGFIADIQWSNTINEVIATVASGLSATGRAATWGFDWPDKSVRASSPFTNKTVSHVVVAEIINGNGTSIGRQTVTIPTGYNISEGTLDPIEWEGRMSFPSVNVNAITDQLTIRISSIDNLSAESAARQHRINILPADEFFQLAAYPTATDESFFTIDSNGTLIRFSGNQSSIVIPSRVNGILVTAIGRDVFKSKNLRSVTIPNSVRTIGEEAFSINQLTRVTIPNSVRTIARMAFSINQLTRVTIPNSVRTIGEGVFIVNQLTSVTIPNSVKTIERAAFGNNQLTSVTIPSSVRTITSAFASNRLTSVTIPNSVRTIEAGAFQSNQLTSITIPNSVRTIKERAFLSNRLTSITIGAGVKIIGDNFGSFDEFYKGGQRAGTYTSINNAWNYSPQ